MEIWYIFGNILGFMMFLLSHPMMFNITMVQDETFEEVVQLRFNIPFKSRLSHEFLASWNEIKNEIAHMVRLYDGDEVSLSLTRNKAFSTKFFMNC
jgi:hypothetical protein